MLREREQGLEVAQGWAQVVTLHGGNLPALREFKQNKRAEIKQEGECYREYEKMRWMMG